MKRALKLAIAIMAIALPLLIKGAYLNIANRAVFYNEMKNELAIFFSAISVVSVIVLLGLLGIVLFSVKNKRRGFSFILGGIIEGLGIILFVISFFLYMLIPNITEDGFWFKSGLYWICCLVSVLIGAVGYKIRLYIPKRRYTKGTRVRNSSLAREQEFLRHQRSLENLALNEWLDEE